MDRLTDCLDMTIVVDWDVKPQNKTKSKKNLSVKNKMCLINVSLIQRHINIPEVPSKSENKIDVCMKNN